MNPEVECEDCRRLHEAASTAITQHLRAAARLDVARLRYQADLFASLEQAAEAAREAREVAVSAFKQHRQTHSAAASGGTAMSQTS
jgi:hypothetical protein